MGRLSLGDLQALVRTSKATDVIHMQEGTLQACGSRCTNDATQQLLRGHHLSMEEPAKAAAAAVRKILGAAGHQPPAPDRPVTADMLRTGLNSIGERQYSSQLRPLVCAETARCITHDMAADAQAPHDDVRWEQMQKDFARCDMYLGDAPMSHASERTRFPEMRAYLENQPELVQRFIRNACHQGSIAAAFSAASRALHKEHAALPAAMKGQEFDIETSFHIDLNDRSCPSIIIYHERNIAAASAMSDVAGMGIDLDEAPRTNADSHLYFHLQISLDTRSGQVSVCGHETSDISYASPRALTLDDAVYADAATPDVMTTMVRAMQGYATLLTDARTAYLTKHPNAGSDAVAGFEHDWHFNALHDLARYRGESLHDVASRVASTCSMLTGQLQDEESLLDALVAQGHLPSTDRHMARDIVEHCSPLHCVRGLVRTAVEQTNNALSFDENQLSTPTIMPADRIGDVHPQVMTALRQVGIVGADAATRRANTPVPPVQRQLSIPDDPHMRNLLLSATTTLITTLMTETDGSNADACAQWLLSRTGDGDRTGLQRWIDQTQSLLQHGIQTSLPLEMQRFAYEQLHHHVQRIPPDGAKASDMLDALLLSGIPAATGRSRDGYLAFCQVVADLLYSGSQPPLVLRKGLRDSTIRNLHQHAIEHAGQPGNGHELTQLLPVARGPLMRLVPGIGSWSCADAELPPPPQQQTGDGGESAASINAHLIAMLRCTQQIIDVVLPTTTDAPRMAPSALPTGPVIATPLP